MLEEEESKPLPDEHAASSQVESFGTSEDERDPKTQMLPVDPIVLAQINEPRLADEIAIDGLKAQAAEKKEAAQQTEQTRHDDRREKFVGRLREHATATNDDFERVLDPDLVIPPPAAEFLYDSTHGPEIAVFMADHPDFGSQLVGLAEPEIEARMQGLSEHLGFSPKKQTSAPDPVPTVGGGGAMGRPDPANMSAKEYAHWRENGGGS